MPIHIGRPKEADSWLKSQALAGQFTVSSPVSF